MYHDGNTNMHNIILQYTCFIVLPQLLSSKADFSKLVMLILHYEAIKHATHYLKLNTLSAHLLVIEVKEDITRWHSRWEVGIS